MRVSPASLNHSSTFSALFDRTLSWPLPGVVLSECAAAATIPARSLRGFRLRLRKETSYGFFRLLIFSPNIVHPRAFPPVGETISHTPGPPGARPSRSFSPFSPRPRSPRPAFLPFGTQFPTPPRFFFLCPHRRCFRKDRRPLHRPLSQDPGVRLG